MSFRCNLVPKKKIFYSKKLHVWCGFSFTFCCRPYFFSANEHAKMLKSNLIPFLRQHHRASSTWFQQDGAPGHVSKEFKSVIKKPFGDRVNSREFPIYWPARSPDISPLRFFFWGYVKSKVYTETFSNLYQLRTKNESVINNIDQAILQKISC